jgi:hypothetical protein
MDITELLNQQVQKTQAVQAVTQAQAPKAAISDTAQESFGPAVILDLSAEAQAAMTQTPEAVDETAQPALVAEENTPVMVAEEAAAEADSDTETEEVAPPPPPAMAGGAAPASGSEASDEDEDDTAAQAAGGGGGGAGGGGISYDDTEDAVEAAKRKVRPQVGVAGADEVVEDDGSINYRRLNQLLEEQESATRVIA